MIKKTTFWKVYRPLNYRQLRKFDTWQAAYDWTKKLDEKKEPWQLEEWTVKTVSQSDNWG